MKKNVWIHVGMIAAMLAVACVFFSPVLSGMEMYQGDTQKFEAMVKETRTYHAQTGDYALWNSSLFGGMPIYQVGGNPPMKSIMAPLRGVVNLEYFGVGRTIGVLFLYLVGFYLALLLLGCEPWVALLGGLAFGLGSYNIIIVEAGHISKAWALAMMAPILAGMVLCLRKPEEGRDKRKDWLWGGLLFTLALGLQLNFNHIQITFYTIIGAVLLGLVHLVYSLKGKYFSKLAWGTGVLLLGCALAFACNARGLMVSQQYAKQTMRGGNAITVTPEGREDAKKGEKSGLEIDYAFNWSYGVGETYTLLVPGAMGGGSGERVSKESASYSNFHQEQMPLYWGEQPFTSGPVYFGAIVIMLFVMGLILVRGPERWWLVGATLVAIVMSWGHNVMSVNEWLFNHLPLYNKFRTPSMNLVLANVCMVLLGMLGLKELFSKEVSAKRKLTALYIAGGATALTLLIGLVASGMLPYSGAVDRQMEAQYGAQWPHIQSIFIEDRKSLFVGDSWRSMIFVVLAFAAMWFYVWKTNKNNQSNEKSLAVYITLALTVLMVVDLWGVDRRYVTENNYVKVITNHYTFYKKDFMKPTDITRKTIEDVVNHLYEATGAATFFEPPTVKFASADDHWFTEFKTIISPEHWTPQEALNLLYPDATAKTVISFCCPNSREAREGNRKETERPCELWARIRSFGDQALQNMRNQLARWLQEHGVAAVAPFQYGNVWIVRWADYGTWCGASTCKCRDIVGTAS